MINIKNHLYEISIEVKPANKYCNMHAEYIGAIVNCYVAAKDHLEALEVAIKQLAKDNYHFINVYSDIREICPRQWQDFLNTNWQEIIDYLPQQDEIIKILEEGGVIYGPFLGYKQ